MSVDLSQPEPAAWDPSAGDLSREHGLYPRQMDPNTRDQMLASGWMQCPTQRDKHGQPCGFMISPQTKAQVENHNGYYTCPKCNQSYDLMEELPWHGPSDAGEYSGSGGMARIGIPLTDQGQIGENIIQKLGEIPGYGPITWWHPGGSGSNAPLDGSTSEWGIEVKTVGYDSANHRFNPGYEAGGRQYFDSKNNAAQEMGLKGILGLLVVLDYRRDVADIYAKEMPLEPREYQPGRFVSGVTSFRKDSATRLLTEVPFTNPYKNPHDPSPSQYRLADYYEQPQPYSPEPSEPMPF